MVTGQQLVTESAVSDIQLIDPVTICDLLNTADAVNTAVMRK